MGFTVIDGGVIAIVILSTYLAAARGVVREVLSVGGWVLAGLVAFALAPMLQPLMAETPMVGKYLSSCTISTIAAYGVVFVIALIVIAIFTPIIAGAVQQSALAVVDRGLGVAFGALRAALLIALMFILYENLVPEKDRLPMVTQSRTIGFMQGSADFVRTLIPTEMPDWLSSRMEQLLGECKGSETPVKAQPK